MLLGTRNATQSTKLILQRPSIYADSKGYSFQRISKKNYWVEAATRNPNAYSKYNPKSMGANSHYPHKEIHKVLCSDPDCAKKICTPNQCGIEVARESIATLTSANVVHSTNIKNTTVLDKRQNWKGDLKSQSAAFYDKPEITKQGEFQIHPAVTTFVQQTHVVVIIHKETT